MWRHIACHALSPPNSLLACQESPIMSWKYWLTIVAILLLLPAAQIYGQTSKTKPRVSMLRNRDVLVMVRTGMKPDLIIATILTSACNFDIFPPVLDDLKRRGVPENVLQVMSVVPTGPPNLPDVGTNGEPFMTKSTVKIPRGTPIIVETLYPISSADFKLNNSIAFSVVRPVFVDGALVIPRGTVA